MNDERFIAFAADDFLTTLEIEPAVAAAILPTGRAARAAVFDEEVAGISVHVRDAPGESVRASDSHDRAAGERRSHRVVASPPPECDFIPDRRQTIYFEMRIGGEHRVACRCT